MKKTISGLPSLRIRQLSLRAVALAVLSIFSMHTQIAQAEDLKIHTNQEMIEDLMRPVELDINNPVTVFGAVFKQLPDKVNVYPGESYYYFTFPFNHVNYAGNIRFDAHDQFDGKVHFAYYIDYVYWRKPEEPIYKKLGSDDGLTVKQLNKFAYTITFAGKTVEFDLPDLSNVKPAADQLRADEIYIGPGWDESGVQFFLIYNKTAKTFLYVLNDNPKMDIYEKSDLDPAVTIGIRTSFTFYKDKLANRQILFGVFAGNTQINNYFDGPFDQLPDNYVQGNILHDVIAGLVPDKKDQLDRYGSLPGGEERYAITSYKYYDNPKDLKPIIDCANKQSNPAKYYHCFNEASFNNDEVAARAEEKKRGEEDNKHKAPAHKTAKHKHQKVHVARDDD